LNPKLIVIDGKTYKSLEEMPEDVRRNYESAFEGMVSNIISSTRIIANGNEYNNLDDLPPDVRAKYEQAMGTLDSNRNGVPDFFEGMMNTPVQTSKMQNAQAMSTPRAPIAIPASPNTEPEATNKWMLALFGVVLFGVCVAGAFAAWYFFLR